MLNLARFCSLVYLMGMDSRFQEFPGESILMYLSSSESESPKRLFESSSIESVKLKAREDVSVDAGDALHFAFLISHLQDVRVKTITGKDIGFDTEEEKEKRVGEKQNPTTTPADLDDEEAVLEDSRQRIIDVVCGELHDNAELQLSVKKQVKICKESVNNVLQLSFDLVPLELVVCNPDFRLPKEIEDMMKSTLDGLRSRKLPERKTEGSSVSYLMQDSSGEKTVSIFKPNDEQACGEKCHFRTIEGRCASGIEPEERAIREVAAYLLDHPKKGRRSVCSDVMMGSAGVPPTVMVRCLHYAFNSRGGMVWKTGSLQKIVENTRRSNAEEYGVFSLDDVQRISVLDIRLANLDRRGDSFQWWLDKYRNIHLVPIDHGFCFPDTPDDCLFEWIQWPKAREQYSSEMEKYVDSLDADKDIEYLKSYGWDMGPDFADTYKICTMLLKIGVEKKLTPYDIGISMVSPRLLVEWRMFDEKHCSLSEMISEADRISGPNASQAEFFCNLSSVMDTQLGEMGMIQKRLRGRR